MTKALPELAGVREFARLAGYKPGYVTQLRKDGRLVLAEDGRAIRVAESLERIKATRDPSKAGVAARHAAKRAEASTTTPEGQGEGEGATDPAEPGGSAYQDARARREHFLAKSAERDYLVSMGKLMDAGEVTATVASAMTRLRTRLESMPDVLGPQLAAVEDEARARAMLAEAVEHALAEASREFASLGKEAAQ